MIPNPPPIQSGWGNDPKSGPTTVWAIWFQNVWNSLTGGQFIFPSTQNPSADPNTLDDYKEASGNLVIAAGAGAITSYTATYQYTKIGNLVNLLFEISITNAGTGVGDVIVTIPHTASYRIAGTAREMDVVGYQCSCSNLSTTSFGLRKYDNTTMITTGYRLVGEVSYFV